MDPLTTPEQRLRHKLQAKKANLEHLRSFEEFAAASLLKKPRRREDSAVPSRERQLGLCFPGG